MINRHLSASRGRVSASTANRRLFEQARALGDYHYPIDSVPKTQADWRRHFGRRWNQFAAIKRAQDPDFVLTPGQGIFQQP